MSLAVKCLCGIYRQQRLLILTLGLGIRPHSTDRARSQNVQRLSGGVQRRCRFLLRTKLVSIMSSYCRLWRRGGSNTRNGVIKVCDEFPGFTRFTQHQPYGAKTSQRISVPRSHAKHPSDTIPAVSEETIGSAIETFLPDFKGKPRFNKTLCWCTDTADSNLLVCAYPGWKGFYIATGDSG